MCWAPPQHDGGEWKIVYGAQLKALNIKFKKLPSPHCQQVLLELFFYRRTGEYGFLQYLFCHLGELTLYL